MLQSTKTLYLVWNVFSAAMELLNNTVVVSDQDKLNEESFSEAQNNADTAILAYQELEGLTGLLVADGRLELEADPYKDTPIKDILLEVVKVEEMLSPR